MPAPIIEPYCLITSMVTTNSDIRSDAASD